MKKITILLFVLLSCYTAFAQEEESKTSTSNVSIGFTPQYLITGGMRMDVDFPIARKLWMTLAPTFYYVDNSSIWAPEYISYTGVGASVNFRYFPSGKGIYSAFGLNYRHINADYTDYSDELLEQALFNSYGFDFSFGYQFLIVEQLFMDLYLGWGFKYSTEDSPETQEYWSNGFLSLAYSGFLPVAGLRVGFEF